MFRIEQETESLLVGLIPIRLPFGRQTRGMVGFPKSQCEIVDDEFFAVPGWLLEAKQQEINELKRAWKKRAHREINGVYDANCVLLNICSPSVLRLKANEFLRANGGLADEANAYDPGGICPDCGGVVPPGDSPTYCVCDEDEDKDMIAQ